MIRKTPKKKLITKSSKITDDIVTLYTAPKLQDPESDSEDDTQAKVAEFDEEYESDDVEQQLSEFRKKNLVILSDVDKKYRGSLVTRQDLNDESDDSVKSDNDSYQKNGDSLNESESENDGSQDIESSDNVESSVDENSDKSEEDLNHEDDESEIAEKSDLESESGEKEDQNDKTSLFPNSSDSTSNVQKGLCVQNQLKIWEKCLEMRIHSQKILNISNSLPSSNVFDQFLSNDDFKQEADKTIENVGELLDKMLELQTSLVSR